MGNAIKKLPHADRLKVAHSAFTIVRLKFSVEEYEETQDGIVVSFYDQFGTFNEETISRQTLISFVLDFYSTVSDSSLGGEHVQYEDTRTADYYLDENLQSVLVDYLNNRKP
jgi:hypothetical protein